MTSHGGVRPGAGRPHKGEEKTERMQFTSEQLEVLLNSPHIAFVSRKTVSFTLKFKELFWQRYCDGVLPQQIFQDAGINPELLGRSRIFGFAKNLRNQKARGVPFNEGDEPHIDPPEKRFNYPVPPRDNFKAKETISPEEVAKMYHKVAYMSQELEFIKKIILAGKEEKST